MKTFASVSDSMAEDVSPCPSSVGGGGAGGGNEADVLSTTSGLVLLAVVPALFPSSTVAACDLDALTTWWEGILVRGRVGCLSPAPEEVSVEACDLAQERIRSNKLGSSEDSTIDIVRVQVGRTDHSK